MGREVDSYQGTLLVQSLNVTPAHIGFRNGRRSYLDFLSAKERRLGLSLFLLVALTIAYQGIKEHFTLAVFSEEGLTTDAKTVKATTEGKRLVSFTVDTGERHALGEIEDVLIGAVLLAFVNDGQGGTVAHTLDSCQTEAYLSLLVYAELLVRLVDIRAQRGNAHLPTLVHEFRYFRYLVTATGHDGSHILCRVVGLHVGSLVGHP